VTSSRRRGNIL